jgi:putative flippase GtrA
VKHCLRFYTVGAAGVVVQLAALALLKTGFGIGVLPATAIAVEMAVLHNFFWHERWTWADRIRVSVTGQAGRLLRFHLTNGLLSIGGNLLFMAALAGRMRMPYLIANILSITLCSLMNFLAADRLVWAANERESGS